MYIGEFFRFIINYFGYILSLFVAFVILIVIFLEKAKSIKATNIYKVVGTAILMFLYGIGNMVIFNFTTIYIIVVAIIYFFLMKGKFKVNIDKLQKKAKVKDFADKLVKFFED